VTAAIDEINGILGRFISDISATKGLGFEEFTYDRVAFLFFFGNYINYIKVVGNSFFFKRQTEKNIERKNPRQK
jgi:hypothetical protein